jgi:hypothetical protein
MPQEEVGSVERTELLEALLKGMGLVRTGMKGFPQDAQHYLGRDGRSVWLQTGPRAFTSTADLFELLEDPLERSR